MNRREWMKMVAAGTPAALVLPGIGPTGSGDAFFIVTDDPQRAIVALAAPGGIDLGRMRISRRRIAPSNQDVTVIRDGRVIDPARSTELNGRVTDLAANLRARRIPADHLVSIEPRPQRESEDVVFECEGRLVDAVSRHKSYNHISIAGAMGETVFSLSDGRLSVVRSSCRHELCRRSGGIRAGRIICAPNRLVASVGTTDSLDAITG